MSILEFYQNQEIMIACTKDLCRKMSKKCLRGLLDKILVFMRILLFITGIILQETKMLYNGVYFKVGIMRNMVDN